MTIDAVAMEPQFVDHLAPVWRSLPDRGRFLVEPSLVDYARRRGVEATPIERPPFNPAYPKPRHDGPPCLVASYGDIKGARRLGYGPFVFLEHGAGQSYAGGRGNQARNGSYAGGADRDDVHLYLVPNETCATRWREAYPKARVEIVGCPKLETLPRRDPDGETTVALAFHWPAQGISPEAGNALGRFGPVIGAFAKRFHVIGHAHPKGDWPQRMAHEYRRWGIEFVPDFEDVCRRADVYVCDNSSTLFEFAATGRPVVVLNALEYRKNVNHGLRFWDAADVGIQVDDPALLGDAVQEALQDAPERQAAREAALDIVYQPRAGGAALAAAAITDWLASREMAAA
jgi:hypothetical protein